MIAVNDNLRNAKENLDSHMIVTVEIEGKPEVYRAPRVLRNGLVYSVHWKRKRQIQWQIRSQYQDKPWNGPLHVKLMFFFIPPKGTSHAKKQQMLEGTLPFCKRPDLSNCIKLIEDCGNGLLWEDDKQIIELEAYKLYGVKEKTVIIMESTNGKSINSRLKLY